MTGPTRSLRGLAGFAVLVLVPVLLPAPVALAQDAASAVRLVAPGQVDMGANGQASFPLHVRLEAEGFACGAEVPAAIELTPVSMDANLTLTLEPATPTILIPAGAYARQAPLSPFQGNGSSMATVLARGHVSDPHLVFQGSFEGLGPTSGCTPEVPPATGVVSVEIASAAGEGSPITPPDGEHGPGVPAPEEAPQAPGWVLFAVALAAWLMHVHARE